MVCAGGVSEWRDQRPNETTISGNALFVFFSPPCSLCACERREREEAEGREEGNKKEEEEKKRASIRWQKKQAGESGREATTFILFSEIWEGQQQQMAWRKKKKEGRRLLPLLLSLFAVVQSFNLDLGLKKRCLPLAM